MTAFLFSIFVALGVIWGSAMAASGPDPMAPLTSGESPAVTPVKETYNGPSLQEILFSPHRVLAVIDGKALKVGEKYRDFKIIGIQRNTVTLQIDDKIRTLHLIETSVEKH